MITALLLRFGISTWLAKLIGIVLLVVSLGGAAVAYHHHVFQQGVTQESARRDKIEEDNSARADRERDALNEKIDAAQAVLDAARADVKKLTKDLSDEKAISSDRQQHLLAGTERMRILARARPPGPDQQTAGGPAVSGDQGAEVVVDIAGTAAAAIDQLRTEHNEAVKRLDACIVQYDAVKAAADAMP